MKKKTYSIKKTTFFFIIIVLLLFLSTSAFADDVVDIDVTMEYYGPFWDVNHDGTDSYLDVSLMVGHYGETGLPTRPPRGRGEYRWDIDGDGDVDYLDVSALVYHYGESWLVSPLGDANTQPSHNPILGAVATVTAIASSMIVNYANVSMPLIGLLASIGIILIRKRRTSNGKKTSQRIHR
jgi:hypothetical protein